MGKQADKGPSFKRGLICSFGLLHLGFMTAGAGFDTVYGLLSGLVPGSGGVLLREK